MLGGLRASRSGVSVERFSTQKTAGVLARLAYTCPRPLSRDYLVETFWPDDDDERGRQNLRQSLTVLRHILEPPEAPSQSVVVATRSDVRINADALTTDVAAFQLSLQTASTDGEDVEAHLKHSVSLYRGELLPGFYDDWVISERRALEEAYLSALRRLVALKESASQFDEALHYVNQWIVTAPDDDGATYAAMRICHAEPPYVGVKILPRPYRGSSDAI